MPLGVEYFLNSNWFEVDGGCCWVLHVGIRFAHSRLLDIDEFDFMGTLVEPEFNLDVFEMKYRYVVVAIV